MREPGRREFLRFTSGAVALALLPSCQGEGSKFPAVGDRFPEYLLPDLLGAPSPVFQPGIPHIINFWASWCVPCRQEMPYLQALGDLYAPTALRVIGVAVDEDPDAVREFLLRHRIIFSQLIDRGMNISKRKLDITAIPITYLVTGDRKIARMVVGEMNWTLPDARVMIEEALAIRPALPA